MRERKREEKREMGRECLFSFLTSSSATMLSSKRAQRLMSDNFTCCHIETEQGDNDLCPAGHIILTPTQSVGSGRLQQELNPQPDQESCALLMGEREK